MGAEEKNVLIEVLTELRGIRGELGRVTERLSSLETQAEERRQDMEAFAADVSEIRRWTGKIEGRVASLEYLPGIVGKLQNGDRSTAEKLSELEGSTKTYIKLLGIPFLGSMGGASGALLVLKHLGLI